MSTLDQTIHSAPNAGRPDALARLTATRAGRWLVPSLADLFFIAFFVWMFVAGRDGWSGLLADGDIGWHIRTGEYILDHLSVPRTDPFSFTKPGAPWFAWEWLSDLLFALVHRSSGLKGVVFLAGVVLTLWILLLLRQALWRGANAWVALAVTLLGAGAASMHFLARPHIFTLLLTTVTVWFIESDLRAPGRGIWWLVPVTAVWANLHGGFLVGIVLLTTAAGALALAAGMGTTGWRAPVRYSVLATACAGASLVNPYGIKLHTHIFDYLRSDWIRNMVEEFQAPNFRSENQLQFEILLITALLVTPFLVGRRRLVEASWILVFAHLSLTSVRHAPVFAAIAVPIVAAVLSELWSAAVVHFGRTSPVRVLYELGQDLTRGFGHNTLWLAVFAIGYWLLARSGDWPGDFPAAKFPLKLVHSNALALANGRVLTLDQWADYLIYEFYPREKVFADGRSDFYGPVIGGEYVRASAADPTWRIILDRYRVDTVLAPTAWPLANILGADAAWRIVASEKTALLFVRSTTGRDEKRGVPPCR